MSVIIRLQNLPWTASAMDIRNYFLGLNIPDGGVHIVGGDKGDAFIAFSTDEDARRAMLQDGGKVKDNYIKLFLSSKTEMQNVIADARRPSGQDMGLPPRDPYAGIGLNPMQNPGMQDMPRMPLFPAGVPGVGAGLVPSPSLMRGGLLERPDALPTHPDRFMNAGPMDDNMRRPMDDGMRRPMDDGMRRPMDDGMRRPMDDGMRRPMEESMRHPGPNGDVLRPQGLQGRPFGDARDGRDNREGRDGRPGMMNDTRDRDFGMAERERDRFSRNRDRRSRSRSPHHRSRSSRTRDGSRERSRGQSRDHKKSDRGSPRERERSRLDSRRDRDRSRDDRKDNGRSSPRRKSPVRRLPFEGPTRCVLVEYMPNTATYKDVRRFFRGHEIPRDGLRLKFEPEGGRRQRHCYVKFFKPESTAHAVKMDGEIMDGNKVQITLISEEEFMNVVDDFSTKQPDQSRPQPREENVADMDASPLGTSHSDGPGRGPPVPDRRGPPGPDRRGPPGPERRGPPGPDRRGPPGPEGHGPPTDRHGPPPDRHGPPPDRHGPPIDRRGPPPDRHGPPGPDGRGPPPDRRGAPGPEERGPPGPDRRGSHPDRRPPMGPDGRGSGMPLRDPNGPRHDFSNVHMPGPPGGQHMDQSEQAIGCYAVVRNLPPITRTELRDFFGDQKLVRGGLVADMDTGEISRGTAYLNFLRDVDLDMAMKKSGMAYKGHRIEVIPISREEFEGHRNRIIGPPSERPAPFRNGMERPSGPDQRRDGPPMGGPPRRGLLPHPGSEPPVYTGSKPGSLCVRLYGLNFSSTVETVLDFLHGISVKPEQVKLLYKPSGEASGIAFVEFTNPIDHARALERDKNYSGKRYINVTNLTKEEAQREIEKFHASAAPPRRGPPSKPGPPMGAGGPQGQGPGFSPNTIFLSGLPYTVAPEEVLDFLHGFGPIPDSLRFREEGGKRTGEAMIVLSHPAAVEKVLNELQGQAIRGRVVSIST